MAPIISPPPVDTELTRDVDDMAPELRPETQRRVDLLFSEEKRAEATRLLVEDCGYNLAGVGRNGDLVQQVRYAALKVSKGDLDRLRQAIGVAKLDYRDIIVKAGFLTATAHKRWMPGEKMPGEKMPGEKPWWKFW